MMKKNIKPYIFILIIIFLVQACAVGPNFHKPEDKTTQTYRYTTNRTDSIINMNWWDLFSDPVLDTLIVTALRENKNVKIAASRIEQARANVSFNKADYGPTFGVQSGASSTNQLFGNRLDNTVQNYNGAAVVNWELDFGVNSEEVTNRPKQIF